MFIYKSIYICIYSHKLTHKYTHAYKVGDRNQGRFKALFSLVTTPMCS